MQILMEGREAAQNWEKDVRALNERTEETLQDVSNLLQSVRNFSEGTLVDEIFDVGTTLVTSTTKLMEGMNKIYDVIDGLLNFLQSLFTGATEAQSDTKKYID